MMKHAEYRIDTLSNMLEIPPEAFERFLAELPNIMRYMKRVNETWKGFGINKAIELNGSTWVDDGECNVELNFHCCSENGSAPNAEA